MIIIVIVIVIIIIIVMRCRRERGRCRSTMELKHVRDLSDRICNRVRTRVHATRIAYNEHTSVTRGDTDDTHWCPPTVIPFKIPSPYPTASRCTPNHMSSLTFAHDTVFCLKCTRSECGESPTPRRATALCHQALSTIFARSNPPTFR